MNGTNLIGQLSIKTCRAKHLVLAIALGLGSGCVSQFQINADLKSRQDAEQKARYSKLTQTFINDCDGILINEQKNAAKEFEDDGRNKDMIAGFNAVLATFAAQHADQRIVSQYKRLAQDALNWFSEKPTWKTNAENIGTGIALGAIAATIDVHGGGGLALAATMGGYTLAQKADAEKRERLRSALDESLKQWKEFLVKSGYQSPFWQAQVAE